MFDVVTKVRAYLSVKRIQSVQHTTYKINLYSSLSVSDSHFSKIKFDTMTFCQHYWDYYATVGRADKGYGLYIVPVYLFFLLIDSTALLFGGAIVLGITSEPHDSAEFKWCLASVITSAVSLVALFNMKWSPSPVSCNPKYAVQVGIQLLDNAMKIVLYIIACTSVFPSDDSWLFFQLVFWYYTAYFIALIGVLVVYYALVLVSILLSSFCCWNCVRCETGGGVHSSV